MSGIMCAVLTRSVIQDNVSGDTFILNGLGMLAIVMAKVVQSQLERDNAQHITGPQRYVPDPGPSYRSLNIETRVCLFYIKMFTYRSGLSHVY